LPPLRCRTSLKDVRVYTFDEVLLKLRQYDRLPQHLVFDSKLTTYDRLDRLDAAGITFITLRRRWPQGCRGLFRAPSAVAPDHSSPGRLTWLWACRGIGCQSWSLSGRHAVTRA
jgi:hypothetical protein